MSTMEKLNGLTIVRKYAQLKREDIYNNPLMRENIKQTIIDYIDNTEKSFTENYITLDEAVKRIADSGNAVNTEKSNKIDVAAMLERFDKEYEFLYENRDNVAGYDEAVTAFDQHLKNDSFKKILKEFIIYRGDIISSDREAAAYMFMCDVLKLI